MASNQMSLSEMLKTSFAGKAKTYRMSEEDVKNLCSLELTEAQAEALIALLKNSDEESWNEGYDDCMLDSTALNTYSERMKEIK